MNECFWMRHWGFDFDLCRILPSIFHEWYGINSISLIYKNQNRLIWYYEINRKKFILIDFIYRNEIRQKKTLIWDYEKKLWFFSFTIIESVASNEFTIYSKIYTINYFYAQCQIGEWTIFFHNWNFP